MAKLTKPLLEAMEEALNAALAGEGFDSGDFAGLNRDHFERALAWVHEQQRQRGERRHTLSDGGSDAG